MHTYNSYTPTSLYTYIRTDLLKDIPTVLCLHFFAMDAVKKYMKLPNVFNLLFFSYLFITHSPPAGANQYGPYGSRPYSQAPPSGPQPSAQAVAGGPPASGTPVAPPNSGYPPGTPNQQDYYRPDQVSF